MTHQYLSWSLCLREVIVTVKTPASLSSAMELLSLGRFLGVFTTMSHSSYIFPLHQYFVWSLNCWSYWQETVTDPPIAAVTTSGADSWSESTACFVSQKRHRTGAATCQKKIDSLFHKKVNQKTVGCSGKATQTTQETQKHKSFRVIWTYLGLFF